MIEPRRPPPRGADFIHSGRAAKQLQSAHTDYYGHCIDKWE